MKISQLFILVLLLITFIFLSFLGGCDKDETTAPIVNNETKIIFIRHGETEWNVLGILQGQADVPMNATGEAQVDTLAEAIKDKSFDEMYSSPLVRAHKTAELIALKVGFIKGEIKEKDGLKENGMGIYTGFAFGQIPSDTSSLWFSDSSFSLPTGIPEADSLADTTYVLGKSFEGESLYEVQTRGWDTLTEIVNDNKGKTIIITGHGCLIGTILAKINNASVLKYNSYVPSNAGEVIIIFDKDGNARQVDTW